MKTFDEYQALATEVPLSLRNNRDRIDLPVLGLQEASGKIGLLLSTAFESGKLNLSQQQGSRVQDGLADILWYVALICRETGMTMQEVATHSTVQLQGRMKKFDPNQR